MACSCLPRPGMHATSCLARHSSTTPATPPHGCIHLWTPPFSLSALPAHLLLPQGGSEPLTPRSEASDVSAMSAEARAYLERHLANIARGRGGLVPAHVQAQLGACSGTDAVAVVAAGVQGGHGRGEERSDEELAAGPQLPACPAWPGLPACLACSLNSKGSTPPCVPSCHAMSCAPPSPQQISTTPSMAATASTASGAWAPPSSCTTSGGERGQGAGSTAQHSTSQRSCTHACATPRGNAPLACGCSGRLGLDGQGVQPGQADGTEVTGGGGGGRARAAGAAGQAVGGARWAARMQVYVLARPPAPHGMAAAGVPRPSAHAHTLRPTSRCRDSVEGSEADLLLGGSPRSDRTFMSTRDKVLHDWRGQLGVTAGGRRLCASWRRVVEEGGGGGWPGRALLRMLCASACTWGSRCSTRRQHACPDLVTELAPDHFAPQRCPRSHPAQRCLDILCAPPRS